MKIYLDGLFYKGSGIGRYYSNLVKLFSENNIEVITAVPRRLKVEWLAEFSKYGSIEPIFVDYERFAFKHIIRHSIFIKKLKERNDLEVFWFPHVNLPLCVPSKTIVTVHDVRPFTEWWDRGMLKKAVFKMLVKRAINAASTVVVPSNYSKNALLNFFPEAKDKLKVIYNFIDADNFGDCLADCGSPVVDGKYILFVGNRKRHKNLKNLIVAFSKIAAEIEHKLVIAGARDSMTEDKDEVDILISELGLNDRIQQFISPPDKIIFNLYRYADLFVFPSFYEGFGYPPLEAVSLGTPAILSDIPIFREIFSDSGYYFDPLSPEDLSEKLLYLLTNEDLRKCLLIKERKRAKVFYRDEVDNDYINLIKSFVLFYNKFGDNCMNEGK
ncbi:MAG: Glycosyl transferase group 1 [Desulfonauticus sp. 38_4375]|nr:MAG: Glycosyl transferase group 1 [Desulfonauticus sp. 38_4375]